MSAVFAAFGIDWHLLLINAINFALLLLALWYFLYAPLTRLLEERRQKVIKGVEDAEAAGVKLHEIEASRAEVLSAAGKEADEVLTEARKSANAKEKQIIAASEAAAENVRKDAEREALELKHQAIEESKKEVAKLVVLGMEKAMQK